MGKDGAVTQRSGTPFVASGKTGNHVPLGQQDGNPFVQIVRPIDLEQFPFS